MEDGGLGLQRQPLPRLLAPIRGTEKGWGGSAHGRFETPGLVSMVRTEPGCVRPLAAVGERSCWSLLSEQPAGSSCGVPSTDSAQAPPAHGRAGNPPAVPPLALCPVTQGPLGHVHACYKLFFQIQQLS